jgi:hypothetical protein
LEVFIANFVYGVYAIRYTGDNYVTKKDYWKAIIEFEFIKKVLFIGLPILFVLEVLLLYRYYTTSLLDYDISVALYAFTIALFFGGVVRILVQVVKRDFRYYFAKGCCKIAIKRTDEFEKIKYLFLTLDSYDHYLRRNTKHGIKDIRKVHSVLLFTFNKDEILKSIYNSLDGDRFKLAEYLSKLFDIPKAEVFGIESLLQKLKSIGIFL